ncbi:MAG: DUF2254 domain-containing protein [Pseudomonadota bacterium]
MISGKRLIFRINRLRERLWFRPLVFSVLSVICVFAARLIDGSELSALLPSISRDTVETLLSILAASMLVIATFAVGSMVSAYTSASSNATPRAFNLVLRDDVSQTAHSTFVGSFIYSVVARVAVEEGYFEPTGYFTIFVASMCVFAIVIMVFVGWVDRIARLGLLGPIIDKTERATMLMLKTRRDSPTLGGKPAGAAPFQGEAVVVPAPGHLQEIHVQSLQMWAESANARLRVAALPGDFLMPGDALAWVAFDSPPESADWQESVVGCFTMGPDRVFDQDPRFGFVVLSEIAVRALSPGINDPGTAIKVVQTMIRLLDVWYRESDGETTGVTYDRIEVPELSMRGLFDDAFTAIGRDGAAMVEVAAGLQTALVSLMGQDNQAMAEAARHHSRLALARSEQAMVMTEDIAAVRRAARSEH